MSVHCIQDLSDKQRQRSKEGEAGRQKAKTTARKSKVLTDRNDYPQNSYCDVVTYEVVITCSWDEQKEKEKKQQN